MAYHGGYSSATYVPGGFDDYYETPHAPDLVAPAPQRIMPEMSDQISEGIAHMDLGNRQSVMSVASSRPPSSIITGPIPKLVQPPPNIPPSDDDFEATLDNARQAVLSSNDPEMQLAWAQDSLQQIEINSEDRVRLQNMQMRRPSTPPAEHQLKMDAMNIVSFLAEQQHPRAEFIRGMWWEFGRFGCQIDKKEAFRCYSRAADRAYARAEYRIGMLYEASNDPAKALKHYHKGVGVGDAACLYRLGMMTLRGQHGQEQDFVRGVELIRQSAAVADDNAAQGAYVYGMLLARDLNQVQLPEGILPFDERAARIEIEKAAYMKFPKAQLKMGNAYEVGSLGCEFNPAYSMHYYALAARQGEPEAEMGLSKWFLVGHEGVFPKNEELAYVYAQRAALSGFANAEFAMGYFNELGIHVPKNIDLAMEWYKKAASNGNTDAHGRIESINKKQVLSRSDHEKVAITRIKSQYGSKRGPRPERFSQGQRLPSIGDGQQSHRRGGSGQYPPRASSAAPYPMNDGPPVLPPLGDRPATVVPYPLDHDSMPGTNGHTPGAYPISPVDRPSSAFKVVTDRPYSAMTVPDGRQRYPSGPAPAQRPATSVDAYGRPPNHRIVSSPAGMPGPGIGPGPAPQRPPKDYDSRLDIGYAAPPDSRGRRPLPSSGSGTLHSANVHKPMPAPPSGSPHLGPSSGGNFPARTSSRPDLKANASPVKPISPAPDAGKQSAKPPASAGQAPAKKPGKGPKTFEEMGVPAKKDEQECIVM
ncbi:hypothetical protein CAC42_1020 [Sphaceloma murrayae]|uniref:Chitin synthase regulatory factor 3 n=1 Tax=Sphaceloma murrayae TaxID=2082308 RepID=A0A2K1R1S7_9PEZI|nr:hypothetical protein CAC42_1020 [Sphaceloma murrayae]